MKAARIMMGEIRKQLTMVRKCPKYIRKSLNYIKRAMIHRQMSLQKNLPGEVEGYGAYPVMGGSVCRLRIERRTGRKTMFVT